MFLQLQKLGLPKIKAIFFLIVLSLIILFLGACSSSPKKANDIENACNILNTHKTWRRAFESAYINYGVPPHVIMAIIYQESRYVYDAKPPKKTFLGIPTVRPSTAYGFPQALDLTWDWYQDKTGNFGASRDELPDAVDFIGWYVNENVKRTNTSKWDAREQYLAYHEGTGGYLKKTYNKKAWLLKVADKVSANSARYRSQLSKCYQYKR